MRETILRFKYGNNNDLSDNTVCSCVYKLTKVVKTNQIWQFQ
jgi:hypothetical protein